MPFTTIVIPKPQYCLDINKLTNKSEQKLDYHAKNKRSKTGGKRCESDY